MSSTDAQHGAAGAVGLSDLLVYALVLALLTGMVDVGLAVLEWPVGFEAFRALFLPIVAGGLAAAIFYFLLWQLAGRAIAVRLDLHARAAAIALALFLGLIFLLIRIAGIGSGGLGMPQLFELGLLLVLGALLSPGAYTLARAVELAGKGPLAAAAAAAAPVVAFAILVFTWAQLYHIRSVASPASLVSILVLLAVLAATVLFARRVRRQREAARVLAVFALALVLMPAVIAAGGWLRWAAAGGDPSHPVRHVVLISSDTLRADVLEPYGNARVRTPALARLAAESVVFDHAYAPAPWTLPSVASFLTGLSPAVHLVTVEEGRLPDGVETLAERMKAAGYYTGAIVLNPYLGKNSNLAQGFHDYVFVHQPSHGGSVGAGLLQLALPAFFPPSRWQTVAEQTDMVIRWMERNADRDFFLWVHYFDPHAPYTPPEEHLEGNPPPGMAAAYDAPDQLLAGYLARTPAARSWIRSLYEAEVRYVDANVGRLIEAMQRVGIYDQSLIVFTSDHGEEFWEHGGQGHGHTLYDELLHVPLILRLPGGAQAGRVAAQVPAEAVAPTLLDLAGIEFEAADFSVQSLTPWFEAGGRPSEHAPVFSSRLILSDPQEAVRTEADKYIRTAAGDLEELFDLRADPGEQENVIDREQQRAAAARALLAQHAESAAKLRSDHGISTGERSGLDAETRRRLEALGYIR